MRPGPGVTGYAMNNTKRFIKGVLSCLLLATGFAHAADVLDPMSKTAKSSLRDSTTTVCGDTGMPCFPGTTTTRPSKLN